MTLSTSATHDLGSLRPLSGLLSLARVRSPEHTRPGEAAPGRTPCRQVAAFTPCQGTVPQASPLTSEHREPECVLGGRGRHRGPPWEAASPHECHTAWRAGTLAGGGRRGQRAAGRVLPRRDPHAPPGREARERTPHDPRASLCFRAVACKLAGHAHAQGSPDPQSSGCRELWPQRPATALSPRSSQRTSGRRERPQCSCSPRATSRRMGQMVPLSLSTFTKHSSGYPVLHFHGLRAPRLSTRILPLVRRDTDLHAHACVCVIFNSVKSTSASEPARRTPGNRAAGHGVQRRPLLRPSSPRATGISLRKSSGNMLFTAPDDSGEKQDSQLPRPLQIPLVSAHYMPDSCKG